MTIMYERNKLSIIAIKIRAVGSRAKFCDGLPFLIVG